MTNDHINDLATMQLRMTDAVRAHWKAFLIEGILLTILGILAVALPLLAGLAVAIMLGWMFLISGIAGLVLTFWAREMPGFWWSLVSAAVATFAGIILLARPLQAVLTLTIVVGAFFLAEGVASIMYGAGHRNVVSRWGWLVAAGILDLIVGFMIFAGLPGSAEWALGLLVGINLVMGGTSMMGMALAARGGSPAS